MRLTTRCLNPFISLLVVVQELWPVPALGIDQPRIKAVQWAKGVVKAGARIGLDALRICIPSLMGMERLDLLRMILLKDHHVDSGWILVG